MNGMMSLLFFTVLMNASGVVAMEPKRRSPTTQVARARQSRGTRVVAKAVEHSNPIPIKNSKPRWAVGVIGLNKPTKLENHRKLICAIKSGELGEVLELLYNKVDVNYCDDENNTPLLCAIFMSHQEDDMQRRINFLIVQKLLEHKAHVNPRHNNPMQVAHLMGNKDIIRLLLSYGARAHVHKGEERTVRGNWQCECDACIYGLQEEHMEDPHVRFDGFLRADLGWTPEEVAEYDRKQEEEKRKRILAKYARNQSFMLLDQRGYYYDPKNLTQTFDLLMKHN